MHARRALELHAEMRSKGLELPAPEMLELIEVSCLLEGGACMHVADNQQLTRCPPCVHAQASMQMEAMGFKGSIKVGVDLLDTFLSRGDTSQRYINPNTAQQLFRLAMQKTVGDLSIAHKLWDMLVAQVSSGLLRSACVLLAPPCSGAALHCMQQDFTLTCVSMHACRATRRLRCSAVTTLLRCSTASRRVQSASMP